MSFGWSLNDVVTQGSKRSKMSHHVPTITSWDINDSLAADFDGSLSGLGSELGTTSYNMSEALLALPVFKSENLDNGFQYILGAATSPAVKLNEETLTYLNQGQSYEIKLKKLGDLSDFQDKFLRSIVKICFHERRLQYMEKEQIDSWRNTRPGERILDIDVPLSYGLVDVNINRDHLNGAEFIWDPTKESGVYIRVNCISTEFTAKKHGGEKGVPFRLQVETYSYGETESKLIHCGSCQIKVFKPKGADRKHKTDREKMEKRTEAEKEKYQPSYECTVLTEVSLDQVTNITTTTVKSPNNSFAILAQSFSDLHAGSPVQTSNKKFQEDDDDSSLSNGGIGSSKKLKPSSSNDDLNTAVNFKGKPLTCDASAAEVTAWLQANRFCSYKQIFQNFSGGDLLRLTRDDLIQICGLADGIRLNNALQAKAIRPRLIIYVCQESDSVYHALYLEHLTSRELLEKLAKLYNVGASQIGELYCQGPSGIYVLLNDEVLQNMSEQSRFCVEAMKYTSDQYKVLLKSIS
ncbi:transcription factor CP2-like isoform X2 [Ostrea edulis]|uniref:transcription factor CP2-like isoform X2 n=1 Tax=Ostrea edulis TaxID=37623 RepID=UPI0024AED078|nr:transcription factor CP2-like isoform X2 [Ostrea edulis]